jgi:alpha-L-rhamnosidase
MVPAPLRARTAARLVELVSDRGDRLDTGFLSMPHLLDVLWDTGHQDVARRLLWQDTMPSWLYEVDRGATTIWESWDAVLPDGRPREVSFNHYAFGCVDDWLYRRIAGLRPIAPGWASAVVEPDISCGLSWARAQVSTPFGRLAVDWRLDGESVTLEVTVPTGMDVELVVGEERLRPEPGTSRHVFRASRAHSAATGRRIHACSRTSDHRQ